MPHFLASGFLLLALLGLPAVPVVAQGVTKGGHGGIDFWRPHSYLDGEAAVPSGRLRKERL